MTQFKELFAKVDNGARFNVDFKRRTIKVGKNLYDPAEVEGLKCPPDKDVMQSLEMLYENYKYSIPSERSEQRQRNYFKAVPYEALSDEQMMYGFHREITRFALETFFLIMVVTGQLKWKEDWGTWFWQSQNDPDLVVLREWVEN